MNLHIPISRIWIFLFLALYMAGCSQAAQAPQATGLGAQSAHAFTVAGTDGASHDHLLTGVTGPDADLHPVAARRARAALDALVSGQALSLTPAGEPDRYARTPVRARLADGTDLAEALVETGWAVVWPREGQAADFTALYTAEARARSANAGAWADGTFQVFAPGPDRLAQRLDGPVIVEGRVVSTGEGRNGRIYLNFGLDWRNDFTVSATRERRAAFSAAGATLSELDGAVVRARGWLYAENGPMIALTHPDQLEILDAPEPAALP